MPDQFPPPGEPQTFVDLLAEATERVGDRVAYKQRRRQTWEEISYRDLGRKAAGISAGLRSLGITPGDRVAIVMENGLDWPVLFFGIVSAGAIAVPIYFGLKQEEVAVMLAHAEPVAAAVTSDSVEKVGDYLPALKALIVAGDSAAVATAREHASGATEVLGLDEVAGRATEETRIAVRNQVVRADEPAAIIFTSGTSGGHKGVVLTHRNVLANVAQTRRVIPFDSRDRLLLVLPLHHSFPFMIALGLVPAIGGELTFETDLRRIRDRMREVKPTLFLGVPALFEMMYRNVVQGIESEGRLATFERGQQIARLVKKITGINVGPLLFKELHARLGGKLKLMVSGGAALSPDTQRSFLLLGLPLIQGWGLSEAGPALAVQKYSRWRFRFTRYYEKRLGSIGRALPGVEVRLRDVPEKSLYVNLHSEGELIARGANITPGYWRSPDLTADLKTGEWLKTGDLGTIDREGNIRITGRSKFIIVLDSGEKVYPDDLEERLGRSPLIADIAVRSMEIRGKPQVCAVIYPDRTEMLAALDCKHPSPEAVLEAVTSAVRAEERDVASFKRIAHITLTDEPLPRTPLQKIMRGQLRDSYTFDPGRWATTWTERVEAEEN
ncbi:MAG: AMP-dependent synthetase/ligase [Dehalococcoidia bacterium]